MKLIPIGGDRWINAELVMAVSVHSTNVTVTMVNGTEVIAEEVGCGGDKNMTEEEKSTPPIDFGTASPGTPGATAETGPAPGANAPKAGE